MSYRLDKPYTQYQRADFIVLYNHEKGLRIEETDVALFALEANEIMQDGEPIINPNYESELEAYRKEQFESQFFETSLGWIRRTVTMKDGSTKDFLGELLMPIKTGLELGQAIEIITYSTPDYTQDLTSEYLISLQVKKEATATFIQECLVQLVTDFQG